MKFFILTSTFCLLAVASYAGPICFAHRGGGWNYFENSISAVDGAIKENFEGTEIDLHQTKDGEIILLHDDNLSRVAFGANCPLEVAVKDLEYSVIKENCKLNNREDIPTLDAAYNLIRGNKILLILDLKDKLSDNSIRKILSAGIAPSRLRITAFFPEFLNPIGQSTVLTQDQIVDWNTIPRYENFRHPVFSATKFQKSFHFFSALVYGNFGPSNENFGVWEVNYSFFLKFILPTNPEFIVTKSPFNCMSIRDNHF